MSTEIVPVSITWTNKRLYLCDLRHWTFKQAALDTDAVGTLVSRVLVALEQHVHFLVTYVY